MILWAEMDVAQISWCATPPHLVRRQARQACGHRIGALLPRTGCTTACSWSWQGTVAFNCCWRKSSLPWPLGTQEHASPVTARLTEDARCNWSASRRWDRLAECGTKSCAGRGQLGWWPTKATQQSETQQNSSNYLFCFFIGKNLGIDSVKLKNNFINHLLIQSASACKEIHVMLQPMTIWLI